MKTKYIKVKVSDRLPSEKDIYLTDLGKVWYNNSGSFTKISHPEYVHPEYWFEKVTDKK